MPARYCTPTVSPYGGYCGFRSRPGSPNRSRYPQILRGASSDLIRELGCGREGQGRNRSLRRTAGGWSGRPPPHQAWYGDETSFGAYVPELPGLGVAGDSVEEVERLIREAIPLHIESLRAHGDPVPPPATVATLVAAPAATTSTSTHA